MLRIGICDDIFDARLALRSSLERLLEMRAVTFQIFEFSSGEGLLSWMQNHRGEIDLVFLDIEMKQCNGMETAHRLRESMDAVQIVFVTGYSNYVYDGYSVGALGYLLKPPKSQQLDDILTRAVTALHRDADQVFVCRSHDTTYRIPRKEILYFVSDRRQVLCVTAARTYVFYGKLDEVKQQVDDSFVRIHQRYLVHATAVERVDGSEVVIHGQSLPISRSHRSSALLALTRAMLY